MSFSAREEKNQMDIIEYHMMDKRRYFPLTFASGLTIRSMLYPFMLIKTRLQIQKGNAVYRGTFDALYKIGANEGVSGLYRGFWVSCLQLIPSMAYITSYERVRHKMADRGITDNTVRSFVAGGVASLVGQTLAVPIDITNQHLMLMGSRATTTTDTTTTTTSNPDKSTERSKAQHKLSSLQHIHVSEEDRRSRLGAVRGVVRSVYQQNGLLGFYKGYFVSLACFAPHSALWWVFYGHYCDISSSVLPESVPRLGIQVLSAPMASLTSAIITNPIDVVRARVQVEGSQFSETCSTLWREEGMWIITKGLSARIIQTVTFSFFIMLGYETIKRWSVLDEYKHKVKW